MMILITVRYDLRIVLKNVEHEMEPRKSVEL